MTTVLEHLESALDHLEQAREKANMGTRLMIDRLITELNSLTQRRRRIEEDDE